jgi:hypothetical protein
MGNESLNQIDEYADAFDMNRSEFMRHAIFIGMEVLEGDR